LADNSKIKEKIEELRNKDIPIYSISRLDTINGCLAEAYKTYIEKKTGTNNIYAILGSKIHDKLEKIVNNEAREKDLINTLNEELEMLDAMNIQFPKDFKGEDSIRDGWIADMTHFCKTYKSPRNDSNNKLHTEELFLYKTPENNYIQGYIDLYKENKDGTISIFDYKTSSMYSKADLESHANQLITYALAKEQQGYKVKSVAWIFLKYVDVTFEGYKTDKSKTKTLIKKTIERKKLGSELSKYIRRDLLKKGEDEIDIDLFLNKFEKTNYMEDLRYEIRKDYKVLPCVFQYPITDETKQKCVDYIDITIRNWESYDKNNYKEFIPKSMEKYTASGKCVEDTFYCLNLCNHRKTCEYIQEYLDKKELKEAEDEFGDLF